MSMKLTIEDNAVLALCRAGIWDDSVSVPAIVDWGKVFDVAFSHGVGAIVCDAIYKNQKITSSIERTLLLNLIGQTCALEAEVDNKINAMKKIAALCESNRIKMLLLKGYALSILYPRPDHRPIGDVDFFCYGEQAKFDAILEVKLGVRPKKSSHHTIFIFEGTEFENHITLFEDDCHRSNKITEEDCQAPLKEKQLRIKIGDVSLLVPNANLNALFLTRHSSGHFATENIQIRHLLDWAFFVKAFHDKIDWHWLMKCSERANMHRFLSAQNTICIKYLGFPSENFPSFYPHEEKLADRIMVEIMHPSFNKDIPPMQEKFVKYCLLKTERLWLNRWKYSIAFRESLLSHFLGYSTNRLRSRLGKSTTANADA